MNTDICVFHLLHNAHQAAKRSFSCELEPTQYLVLKALRELGDGVNQKRLVGATGIDRSTVSNILWRLSKKGLVTMRISTQDTRAVSVCLTDQGKKAVLRATEAAERANEEILGKIPQAQRRAFVANLERIGRGPARAVREAA